MPEFLERLPRPIAVILMSLPGAGLVLALWGGIKDGNPLA